MPRKGRFQPPTPIGDDTDPEGLVAYAYRYIEHLEAKGYSPQTLKNRRGVLRALIVFLTDRGMTRPSDVSRTALERYQRQVTRGVRKADGKPLSASSKVSKLVPVRGFFTWLARRGVLRTNPASEIVLPRAPKRVPRNILSAKEVERILAQPDVSRPLGLRDRAMLEVFYSTGMRRAELVGLLLGDVSFSRGVILIREGKGRKDRVVPVGERAVLWMQKYLADGRPEILLDDDGGEFFVSSWGGGLGLNTVSELVKRYRDQAGIEKQGACHMLRHTMATLMLENGADVRYLQEMLGHAELSTTAIYTHVSISKLQEVHAATHPAKLEKTAESKES